MVIYMVKRKSILKFILFILITALLIISIQTNVNATDPSTNPDWWEPTVQSEDEIASKAGVILGVINVIGIVSSVIVGVLIGFKYMMGSVSEKAEYKKSLTGYIVGIILLVLCSTIPNLIYIIVKDEPDSTKRTLQSNYYSVITESEKVR